MTETGKPVDPKQLNELFDQGMKLFHEKKYESAIVHLAPFVSLATSMKDSRIPAAWRTLLVCYGVRGDSPAMEEAGMNAIHSAEELADPLEIARSKSYAAAMLIKLGKIEQGERLCHEALSGGEKHGDVVVRSDCWNTLGNLAFQREQYERALECQLSSLAVLDPDSIQQNIQYKRLVALNTASLCQYHLENLEAALEYAYMSLDVRERLGLTKSLPTSYLTIGMLLKELDQTRTSLRYYLRGLHIASRLENDRIASKILNNIGTLYLSEKKPVKALEYYHRALALRQRLDEPFGLSVLYGNLATALADLGSPEDQIVDYIQKGLLYAEREENQEQRLTILLEYCQSLIRQGYLQQAGEFYEEILQSMGEVFPFDSQMEVHAAYSRFCEMTGNLSEALEHYKKYSELRYRVFNREREKVRRQIQAKYELERRSRMAMIARQEAELAKKDAEILRLRTVELEKKVQEEVQRRQEQQRFLLQKSKLESLGKLAAGIAHEVNQPLTRMMLGLDNMLFAGRRTTPDREFIEHKCKTLLTDAERIEQIIEHVKTFSRDQKTVVVDRIDLNEVVRNSMLLFEAQYRNHGIDVRVDLSEEPVMILGNAFRIEQVLLNLIANARDALEATSRKKKCVDLLTRVHGENVVLEVRDNGCGMAVEDIEQIFEPFFTTKDAGKGTGLGLSICYGIIQEMNGEITAESESGKGTIIRMILPVSGGGEYRS